MCLGPYFGGITKSYCVIWRDSNGPGKSIGGSMVAWALIGEKRSWIFGANGYYRRFVWNYGQIARPLVKLLKKDRLTNFHWTSTAQSVFKALQKAVTAAPVFLQLLIFPNCLSQSVMHPGKADAGGQPVAYYRKALSDRSLAKSVYEIELMALVLAAQHWQPHLVGRRFTRWTHQRSLCFLLEQFVLTPAQKFWVARLLGYHFEIEYRTGVANRVADALSRSMKRQIVQIYQYLHGWDVK